MRAISREPLEKERRRIGRKVRELRERRLLTQSELARRLSMSQARLSQVEAGRSSLTAEQFLVVLRTFNVSVSAFAAPTKATAELQATLARLGASQLQEDVDVLPSERLEKATDAIRETLIEPESPRLVTALAPVIVHNIDRINWPKLGHELRALGLGRRLRWLVENVLEAVRSEASALGLPLELRRAYRRAEAILGTVHEFTEEEGRGRPLPDVLDRGIRTRRTREEVSATASAISQRHRIVTSIQPADFAEALRGARVGDR
ncbi:MAG: helix-turn-helix transcriptional regulator [Deltaproteobacteria bacterium]|nr:helix-turn-helix transcriptional regulator [Deltaproteobacteria bacterium]